jgi:hypothetical protein
MIWCGIRLGLRRWQRFRSWGRDRTRFWKRIRLGDERFGLCEHIPVDQGRRCT